jgi:phospholipid/cholesterol/gamma-HCH transport system substrate-binding protein
METKAHFTLIGAFALAVVLAAVGFIMWIAKAQFDQQYDHYTVRFSEAVSGLAKGAAVQYHGIQVGEVRSLRLDPEDPRHVLALIRVQGGTPIKTDTSAKLTYQGITGVAVVQLFGGDPSSLNLASKGTGEVPIIHAQSSDLERLMSGSADVVSGFHETLTRVSALLNDDNLHHISLTLKDIAELSAQLKSDQGELSDVLSGFRGAAGELQATAHELRQVLAKIDIWLGPMERKDGTDLAALSAQSEQAIDALKQLAVHLDQILASNQRALAQFGSQGLPAATQSLQELAPLLRRLERVLADFSQQPRDSIFGGGKAREVELK